MTRSWSPLDCMIVGAQKASTTSLLHYLADHPQICAALDQEMTYFLLDAEYTQGYERAFAQSFPACTEGRLLLAKNVGVMYSQQAVDRLYDHNPEVKVVVLLREPVARAYSAYWYARRMGWEQARSFEQALALEAARRAADPDRWRNCLYLHRSAYDVHVRRVLARFGESNVQVILQDDLEEDAAGVCQRIFDALQVDSSFRITTARRYNTAAIPRTAAFARLLSRRTPLPPWVRALVPPFAVRNVRRLKRRLRELNETSFRPPEMAEETRVELVERLRPHNAALGELLDRDLSHWC